MQEAVTAPRTGGMKGRGWGYQNLEVWRGYPAELRLRPWGQDAAWLELLSFRSAVRLILGLPTQNKAKQNTLILEPVATTLKRAVTKGMLRGLGSQEAQVLSSSSCQPPSSSPYWQSPAGSSWQSRKVCRVSWNQSIQIQTRASEGPEVLSSLYNFLSLSTLWIICYWLHLSDWEKNIKRKKNPHLISSVTQVML